MPEYSAEDGPGASSRTLWTEQLRLGFSWGVDRWWHDISVRSGGKWLRVARGDSLPPPHDNPGRVLGPAYQQFHHQAGDGRAFALLVGQSGPHHFSASFEVEDGATTSRIKVDVADRVRVDDPWLACPYVVMQPPAVLVEESAGRVAWDVGDAGRLILSQASPPGRSGRVVIGEPFGPGLPGADRKLPGDVSHTSVHVVEDPEPGAASLRCRYHWTFEAAKDRGP